MAKSQEQGNNGSALPGPVTPGEAPPRTWEGEHALEDGDLDDDSASHDVDVQGIGSVYESRNALLDAAAEIKEKLRRRR